MRERFDELWILDLGGEGRGARRSENVFAIQTPVAIALGYRADSGPGETPAQVRYARVDGTREEKLAALAAIASIDDVEWRDCYGGWTEPFLPVGEGDYFAWPALTDLFPWQQSGVKPGRTWPISPFPSVLETRWRALLRTKDTAQQRTLFKDSPTGRKLSQSATSRLDGVTAALDALSECDETEPLRVVRYAYRPLDRQYLIGDPRVIDRPGPPLWRSFSSRQIALMTLTKGLLGGGQAAYAFAQIPDLHAFRGSFGGKDVIPLWRDAECTEPNLTGGVLAFVREALGREVTPEDLLAYCYALLSAPSYTNRFFGELEIPGPRIPLTTSPELFERAVALGRELVWLHTYGERFVPADHRAGRVPQGDARYVRPIPQTEEAYPEHHSYDPDARELHVGAGVFGPVTPAVRAYEVSGLDVIGSWLDYRMKAGAGRRSSPLDEIRPTIWPEAFTTELLELLWVIERTVALGPELDATLKAIIGGPTIPATALPTPTDEERRAPS